MLEDTNILRGARDDGSGHAERIRSGRRTAVVALVASVLWGFGFLSVVGALTGLGAWVFLRAEDADSSYPRVALSAIGVGLVGIAATVVAVAV